MLLRFLDLIISDLVDLADLDLIVLDLDLIVSDLDLIVLALVDSVDSALVDSVMAGLALAGIRSFMGMVFTIDLILMELTTVLEGML